MKKTESLTSAHVSGQRTGFTLIELVVCVAIITILASLLFAAVNMARESSRRLSCQNNIRQVNLGLQQVIDKKKTIPGFDNLIPSDLPHEEPLSVNPLILIAQELSIPYKAYHFNVRFDEEKTGESFPPSLFTCPSTGDRFPVIRFNVGVEKIYTRKNPRLKMDIFSVGLEPTTNLSDITDGLSNTIALSERPSPVVANRLKRSIVLDNRAESFEEMSDYCRSAWSNQYFFEHLIPLNWWTNGFYESCYDHTRTPNSSEVDCVSAVNMLTRDSAIRILISARSYHSGGVNVALLDGSVSFVSDQIDLKTWRALGTHNAGDVVGSW